MRALLCTTYGPPEALELADVEPPPMARGCVRLAVQAAALNFPDLLMLEGKYQVRPPMPFVPGSEVCGVVTEVADGVTELRPGDRVAALCGTGGLGEEVVVPAAACVPIPDDMDDVTGAALLVTYGTTAYALVQRAALQPGESLLVHGASGGVGLAAVEIGRAMGADPIIATGSSPAKLEIAGARGAHHLLDATSPSLKDDVKALTGGSGVDVVYDPVGGDLFDASMRCIAFHGRLLVIGFASGRIPTAAANLALLKGCSIVGVFWGAWTAARPAEHRANLARLLEWWATGDIRPHVSHVLPLEQGREAMRALADRQVVGKAVVTLC